MKSGNLKIKNPISVQKIISMLLIGGLTLLLALLVSISIPPTPYSLIITFIFGTVYIVAMWYVLFFYKIIQPFINEISITKDILFYRRVEPICKITRRTFSLQEIKEVKYLFQSHYIIDTDDPFSLIFIPKDATKHHEILDIKDWTDKQIETLLLYLKKHYNIVIKNQSQYMPLENTPGPLQLGPVSA